ncbi:MAG TPA: GntR family transcriptional regulator [Thiobacillaceae bacterium]
MARNTSRVRVQQQIAADDGDATLMERAYTRIEELIVTLRLAPGTVVTEAQLSDMLGIGRTPIREALQRLAAQRLVRILPRRGIVISEIDVKAQLRLLEVRRELERLICRKAARRASDPERKHFAELAKGFRQCARDGDEERFMRMDREFNELCLVAARNEFATGAMNLMNSLSRRFWFLHYRQAADLPLTAKLHAEVAHAIAAGDEDAAEKASEKLLDTILEFTRATVSTDY